MSGQSTKQKKGKGRGWHVGWAPPVRLTTDRNCGFTDFATRDVYSVGPPFFHPFFFVGSWVHTLDTSTITLHDHRQPPKNKYIYIYFLYSQLISVFSVVCGIVLITISITITIHIKIVCSGMGTRGIRKGQFVGGASKRHL